MAGFVRRFSVFPTLEQLTSIESVDIIDLPPPSPTVGVGTGTLLFVGEMEDGPFATGENAEYFLGDPGVSEIFSSQDLRNKFGGFGFTYGTVPYENACARRHLSEDWNGNGFIHLKYLRPARLIIARVDTSVGEVSFAPLASIYGGAGPFALTVGMQIAITTSSGGPASSTAIAAAAAQVTGTAGTYPTLFAGGESVSFTVDGAPAFVVTFSAADQTLTDVISRINLAAGYTFASNSAGQLRLTGSIEGTSGSIVRANVSGTPLATFGITAGTTAGTGNVANLASVGIGEVATIINATSALNSIGAKADLASNGHLRLYHNLGGGSISVAAGAMATALLLVPTATTVTAGEHPTGTIPAGTRVRTSGGDEWVTMQTLTIPAGTSALPVVGPFSVKVRPALDNGLATGTSAATVTILVDQPTFSNLSVTNVLGLSAAKTEPQMDVAYENAFDMTTALDNPVRSANFSMSARTSDPVKTKGRQNALDASANGCFGRKFNMRPLQGTTLSQSFIDRAAHASERVNYCYPSWDVRIPEIAEKGASAGGVGFTDSGVIEIGSDGPLATINCRLAPEENPGQDTNGLIDEFFAVHPIDVPLTQSVYAAFKANGICAPRVDAVSGSIYQSGVTADITPGLKTQARRKMADFIQDTLAQRLVPYSKKLATNSRKTAIRTIIEEFLTGLKSENNPELQRIADYSVDSISGNTPSMEALGIFVNIVRVRTLASLDNIVIQTEIGEGVIIVSAN